ncbi:MAG: hypothetical protein J5803_00500 [Desulfovibrio sp.]|nr:hypothetical protein [Desulfovibrio sp.]
MRLFLHGLIKATQEIQKERNISLHFSQDKHPYLAALIYPMHIQKEETAAHDTRKGRLIAHKRIETADQTQYILRSQTLLPLMIHLVDECERTLQAMDAHWPGVSLYTESVTKKTGEIQRTDCDQAWTKEDWLYNANVLKALRMTYMSFEREKGEWLTRENALHDLEEANQLRQRDPYILSLLAEARLLNNLPQQSAESATQALSIDDSIQRARYIRALANWQVQQLGLAENDLSVLLEQIKTDDSAEQLSYLRARGAVRMLLGRIEGMCHDFTKACALGDCDGLIHVRKQDYCLSQ